MIPITLHHYRAPGDVLMMTSLVRDLALTYPNQYKIVVNSPYPYIWERNPYIECHISGGQTIEGSTLHKLGYGASMPRKGTTERKHFVSAFHDAFKTATNRSVPLTRPHADLHLTAEEKKPLVDGRYWVILSGGKSDFKTKHWRYLWHQETANALMATGLKVVGAGAISAGNGGTRPSSSHPRLSGVVDMVGKTNLREFIRLIHGADGVIGPVTFAMHAAAALGRPYVCIAGGVEEWWWESYYRQNPSFGTVGSLLPVEHRYLHTMGLLSCCEKKGCWKLGVSAPEDRGAVCHKPVKFTDQTIPRCMEMITPDKVIAAALSYYLDGTLTPVPGMNLPAVNNPTTIRTNTGRMYAVSLSLIEPGDIIPAPVLPVLPQAPTVTKNAKLVRTPPTRQDILNKVGGRLTGFVLLYGDFHDMHARCLSAILATTKPEEYELRVFLNATCDATTALVEKYHKEGRVSLIYRSQDNCFKYPAMRQMFHDPANPVTTEWLVWFDDDTMADVDQEWLPKLCTAIHDGRAADPMVGMVGPKYMYTVQPKQIEWMRSGVWHRNKAFRDKLGRPSTTGQSIHFITGSCWAMKASLIRDADIPDRRLAHNGGDVTLGEQVYQAGATLKGWNGDKKTVLWSSVKRRGVTQPMFNMQ